MHKAQMWWLCNLFKAFFHACECWWKCWRLKADFCVVGGCRRMCLGEGMYTCCNQIQTPNVSSPSYFMLSLLWHPFLLKSQGNPRNWCLLLFLKPKVSFEETFSWRVVETDAIFKSFSCNQLLANDISCLFFSGKALCPPSALHTFCSTWPHWIPHLLSAGVQLGFGCLEPLTLNLGKRVGMIWEAFQRQGILHKQLKEEWFM